jgi:hypothetical protein
MNEILAFMLDFSVPLGVFLALSLVFARSRDTGATRKRREMSGAMRG